jgi:hypothetical protein
MCYFKLQFFVIFGFFSGIVHAQALVSSSIDRGAFVGYTLKPNDRLVGVLTTYKMDPNDFFALNPSLLKKAPNLGAEVLVYDPPKTFLPNPFVETDQVRKLDGGVFAETIKETEKGKLTVSGQLYNPERYVGASAKAPIGTILYVYYPVTGRSVYVSIIDSTTEVDLALSSAAAKALALDPTQRAMVQVSEE